MLAPEPKCATNSPQSQEITGEVGTGRDENQTGIWLLTQEHVIQSSNCIWVNG